MQIKSIHPDCGPPFRIASCPANAQFFHGGKCPCSGRGTHQRDTLFVDNTLILYVPKRNSLEKALVVAQESDDEFGNFADLYPYVISLNKK